MWTGFAKRYAPTHDRGEVARVPYVAKLVGGPANGRRWPLEGSGTPHEVTIPASSFDGQVDATYVFGGGSHSANGGPDIAPYLYRLPDGSLDPGPDRLDPGEEQTRQLGGNRRTALRGDGLVNVWYADGPRAGTSDVWAAVIDDRAADEIDPSQHPAPAATQPYQRSGRVEVRGGLSYEVYFYAPKGHSS